MSILSHLHPNLKIAAQDPGCAEEDIRNLINFSPVEIPPDYLELVRDATEVEIEAHLGGGGNGFYAFGAPQAASI